MKWKIIKGNMGALPKYNTKSYIEVVAQIHNYVYEYGKTVYSKSSDKITVTCKLHGDFSVSATEHKSGTGCQKCTFARRGKSQTQSIESYIEEVSNTHKFKYDYSLIKEYSGQDSKISIICPIHGIFHKIAHKHKAGKGCTKCSMEKGFSQRRDTLEQFIAKAKKYHGDDLLIVKFCMMNSDQQNQSVSFASVTEKSHSLSCLHEIVLLRAERAVS